MASPPAEGAVALPPEADNDSPTPPAKQDQVSVPPKKSKFGSDFFTFFHLLFYASPTWVDVALLLGGTVAAAASGVPYPLMGIIFGQLVDSLNADSCENSSSQSSQQQLDPGDIQSQINDKVLKLVYISIASFLLIYIYQVCFAIFSRRLESRLRDLYFSSLLSKDATFFDARSAGELTSRLNADIQAVQSGTSEKVGICVACTAFFLTAYVVAFTRDVTLAAMLISLVPAFLIMAGLGSYWTGKFTTGMSDAIASASSIAQEALSHIAVVQAFDAGPRLERIFASRMMVAQKNGVKKAVAAAVQAGMLYFIAYSANALAFWQGSRQIADGLSGGGSDVSVGRIYTVIFLLVDACVILGSVAPILPMLGTATASFKKLRADIESPVGINSRSDDGASLQDVSGNLSFDNVSFSYSSRPDQPVLKDLSFKCPAGRYTALVGLSGSGKSTIAGLITRLYDPAEGTVTLDGHNLKELNVHNLRSHMSLVQQEPSLLDRSVLENIALGLLNSPQPAHQSFQSLILEPTLSELAQKLRSGEDLDAAALGYGQQMVELVAHVRHAASLADAASFIEKLENGYGTLVGTGGNLVSGGQRQRIALARALIRDPKILVLDEATASLDSASEQRIQTAIESIAKGRTVVAIAHRLSTIKNADNIIVMSQGEILEQGTHLELMALNGTYAGMVRLQNIEAKDEDAPSVSSTSKGDTEVLTTEKDSITDEKAAAVQDIPEEAPESSTKPAGGSEDLDSNQPLSKVAKFFYGFIRPRLHVLALALFSGVIVGATFSANALIFGNTVGRVAPCNPVSEIRWAGRFFGGMFFMLAVVELLANSTSWSSFGLIAEKLLYKIRVLSFRSLYTQGLDWHQGGGRTPAGLLSIITADAAAVGGFSGSIMGNIFSITVNFLIAIILSHILSWKIAIVCLVVIPLLMGAGIMQMRSLARFERKHAGAFSTAIGITVEAVNSFKTVSSFSIEDEVIANYRRALRKPSKEIIWASAYTDVWFALSYSIGTFVYAFAYWWGSTRITKGEASSQDFFIILFAMLVSAQLWGQMFSLAPEVSRAKAAASRILNLLDLGSENGASDNIWKDEDHKGEKDIEDTADAPLVSDAPRGVTVSFKDVSFAYPARPQVQILRNMSFTIPAGQFCGLVGPSGAGKSTIMTLVQRMYAVTGGAVEINGQDIASRQGTAFRNDMAVVPQDCALFDGTIKFNVGLGAIPGREATQEDIEEACRLANIHETIMSLPNKYDTECGPAGSRLSGGQRQRLAIARALVRKPKLLLLDESTSALDAESERALQEGLERAARGITVIAITHRLHTVRKADVIFVVEGGQVVEKGTHEELVERSESYRVNALQQMLGT